MQKIERDLFGNVVVSKTQPQGFEGFVFRMRIWLFQLVQNLVFRFEKFLGRASTYGDEEFFDPKDFPWVAAVEADWRKVRAELDALLPYAANIPAFQELQPPRRRSPKTTAGKRSSQREALRKWSWYTAGQPRDAGLTDDPHR